MVSKTLAAIQKRAWVAHCDDERDVGNSIIVTLKDGWFFDDGQGGGVKGFDTLAQALKGTGVAMVKKNLE